MVIVVFELTAFIKLVILEALYNKCDRYRVHGLSQDDETFTFSFNMIVTRDGVEETHEVNKTCTPALPWSSRELNCEVNYMEVSRHKLDRHILRSLCVLVAFLNGFPDSLLQLTMRKDMRFPGTKKDGRWTSTLDVVSQRNTWKCFLA